jgi:hypothetical protein
MPVVTDNLLGAYLRDRRTGSIQPPSTPITMPAAVGDQSARLARVLTHIPMSCPHGMPSKQRCRGLLPAAANEQMVPASEPEATECPTT